MTLRAYLLVLLKRWRIVAAGVVFGLAAASAASLLATPTYTANATAFVAISSTGSGTDNSLYQSSQFAMQRVKSYTEVVRSPDVLQPVIDELDLEMSVRDLRNAVTAENPVDTVLIQISAVDPSATRARDIANAVSDQLGLVIERLETPREGGQSPVKVTTTVPSQIPQFPTSPRIPLNLVLGLLAGLALGIIVAVVREQQDTTVKGTELDELTGRAPLALIGVNPRSRTHPLVALEAHGRGVEEFRSLRTTLQFVDVDAPPRVLVVTSPLAAEGKSTTACNLAITLAQSSLKVVLVEADLRRPMASTLMGVDGSIGLSNVVAGQLDLEDALLPWHRGLLTVLPAGTIPPDPTRLLGSNNMEAVLATLRERYDYVIIDAPPILPVSDAAVLAREADGAVVVARHGKTRREQLVRAIADLEAVQARVVGTVLTLVPLRSQRDLRYHNEDYASLKPPEEWATPPARHERGPGPSDPDARSADDRVGGPAAGDDGVGDLDEERGLTATVADGPTTGSSPGPSQPGGGRKQPTPSSAAGGSEGKLVSMPQRPAGENGNRVAKGVGNVGRGSGAAFGLVRREPGH